MIDRKKGFKKRPGLLDGNCIAAILRDTTICLIFYWGTALGLSMKDPSERKYIRVVVVESSRVVFNSSSSSSSSSSSRAVEQ